MKWISCKKRLPPNGVYVLGAHYDPRPKVEMFFIEIVCRHNNQWEGADDGQLLDPKHGTITHWMNLPDPPGLENSDD